MSVLQRKAQAGRQEHQARAMSVPKSLRLSIAKVANDLWDMAIAGIAIAMETREADALEPEFTPDSLLLLLDGPEGATGAAVVGRELVGALVQQQTIGRVSPQPMPERALTSTDAALCAPLLDAVFARAHSVLETDEDRRVLPRFKFGARCENARLLKLALEEPDYTVIKMTVDIAGGAHQSGLVLVLPVPKAPDTSLVGDDKGAGAGTNTLEKVAMTLQTELRAMLCKIRVPVSQFGVLQPGMTLTLPPDAFPEISVEAIDGRVLAKGELGQVEGQRALRLQHRGQSLHGPMRRASDQSDLDMPDISMADMGDGDLIDMPVPFETVDTLSDVDGLPDLDDLPGLSGDGDDMPILTPENLEAELGLTETADTSAAPSDLPDLDNLPDLSDLPELDDLPDLNTA